MEKKLIEYRTGCCLRRTLATGRHSEDRCWGTMKMNDETVKGLLRKAGLKVTNQRMMVLDIIASHPAEHLTAEEIYDLAKVNSPEIGLATIYRTVQVLLDLHVIDKVTFDDGFTRYELNGEESASGHRHHLHRLRKGVFPGIRPFGQPGRRGHGETGLSRDEPRGEALRTLQ